MFTKFILAAVLVSAPLLSNATPFLPGSTLTVTAPAVTVTLPAVTVTLPSVPQCTTPAVTTGGIPTLVINLVNALNGLDLLLVGVKSLLSNVLNGVGGILGGLTGTTQVILLANVVVFHLRALQATVDNLVNQLQGIVTGCGGVNDILSGLTSGAASATTGTQIFNTANNLLGQLTPVIKQVRIFYDGVRLLTSLS
ncbi:hypothetical protein B0H19DRAFT_208301 [Mycena capillaripes]|nr:hypothetical protein B0H19DRAFT_208301 [Mycena capillaripes]